MPEFTSNKACFFCKSKQEPNYKEAEILSQFISGRKKITGRSRTGVCRKHQRQLAKAIKRARHLALLPFVANIG